MADLDLQRDLPEDFEGRTVLIEGGQYRIGALLGEGHESFTHALVNSKSGLALHVIKLLRDQQAANYYADLIQRLGAVKEDLGLDNNGIPNIRLLTLHGGIFQLQDNLGDWGIDSATSALLNQAGTSFDQENYKEAEQIYERILQSNPYHTIALSNLAATLARTRRTVDALLTMRRVVTIEPNFCDYYRRAISLACRCPFPRMTIQLIRDMKSKFSYACESDDILAESYLVCGDPQKAQDILRASHMKFDAERRRSLDEKISSRLDGSRAAAEFIEAAEKASDDEKIIAALERACGLDPYNPYSRANLAFTLRRMGEYRPAAELLSTVEVVIRPSALADIRFNAGVALFQAGDIESATKALRSAVPIPGSPGVVSITEADLPTIAIWISEDMTLAESVERTFLFLKESTGAIGREVLAELLEQYARFAVPRREG